MYRVFCSQWLPAFTSSLTGEAGAAECEAVFAAKYEGRVHGKDWRIDAPDNAYGRSFLMLRLPNCCGEFTGEADAQARAGENGHEDHPHQVVVAGSAEERELLAYGRRRLRGAEDGTR
jgi:hypothetical protein